MDYVLISPNILQRSQTFPLFSKFISFPKSRFLLSGELLKRIIWKKPWSADDDLIDRKKPQPAAAFRFRWPAFRPFTCCLEMVLPCEGPEPELVGRGQILFWAIGAFSKRCLSELSWAEFDLTQQLLALDSQKVQQNLWEAEIYSSFSSNRCSYKDMTEICKAWTIHINAHCPFCLFPSLSLSPCVFINLARQRVYGILQHTRVH